MTLQLCIIFAMLAAGEAVVWLTGVKIPSSIIGMLLLTACLKIGVIKLEQVKGVSDFLTRNLAFFFIPPGVSLMLHFDLFLGNFWAIIISVLVSTILVMGATAWSYKLVSRHKRNGNNH